MTQSFDSFCDGLIPQGNVVSKRDYVRVTLLSMTLDEAVDLPDPDAKRSNAVVMGLPMALIDRIYGYQATGAGKIAVGKREYLLGSDGIFLPGLSDTKRSHSEVRWMSMAEVRLGKGTKGHGHPDLDEDTRAALIWNGAAVVSIDDKRVLLRLRKDRPSAPASGTPNPYMLFSQTSLAAFTSGQTGYEMFISHLRGLGNTMEGIINGFRADARSAEWHDSGLRAWNTWIPQLPDDVFEDYLSRLQMHPTWPRLAGRPQFPNYPIAIVNVYQQTQTLLGYTRGRLVESVTLGPEEVIETEVFSWDRSVTERNDTYETKFESATDRQQSYSTNAQVTANMESSIGANIDGNLGVGLPLEKVKVDGGIDGGVTTELSSSNANTIDLLSRATSKATERFSATHQVKTLSRRETGTETRSTRTFKNPNLGRTLDVHHFEVVAQYKVKTELDDQLRLALLVENEGLDVTDREWIRAHHHFLDDVLLHDVYREGLDAAQVLAAQEWIDELAAAEIRAAEEERQRLADQEAAADATAPGLPRVGIFDKALKMQEAIKKLTGRDIHQAVDVILRFHVEIDTVTAQELIEADKTVSLVAWWLQFTMAYPAIGDLADQYVTEIEQAKSIPDPERQKQQVISSVGLIVNNLDDDWLVALKTFGAGVLLFELSIPAATNPVIYAYLMKLLYAPNDAGLQKLISRIRADYAQHEAKQAVETLSPPAPDETTLAPKDKIAPPPRAYTQKEIAEAQASFGRLKLHLSAHEMLYRNEFFKREDPALRMQRLQSMGVADFVENSLLGFAGTSAIYPLKTSALPTESRERLEALLKPREDEPARTGPQATEIEITLPTGGVTSEVSIGACEALEPHLVSLRSVDLRVAEAQARLLEASVSRSDPVPDTDSTTDDDTDT